MKNSIAWADNAKALLIFLVVLGHMYSLPVTAKTIIYSFHLPCFLFVTGYLTGKKIEESRPQELFRNSIQYHVSLYLLFSTLAAFIWYALEGKYHGTQGALKVTMGVLGGVHGPDLRLIHNNDPLWYFPFLITSTLVFYCCTKLRRNIAAIALCAASLAMPYAFSHGLPWSLDLAPMGAMFLYAGGVIRNRDKTALARTARTRTQLMQLAITATAWATLLHLNGYANMNARSWGLSTVTFVLTAFAGIFSVKLLLELAPETKFARSLSQATLVIFCTHMYLIKAQNKIVPKFFSEESTTITVLSALVITAACWALSNFIQPLLTKTLKPGRSNITNRG